ncbi:MAG: DNA cytosine methyltransferase [Phycisphaeraceae bacterium]
MAISLFSGAGGCSFGFARAGYNIVHALDIDPTAVATYRQNFAGTPCDVANIRVLNWHALMRRLDLAPGELDMLIGGPPCQGFSTAGMRFWDDPRNSLLKSYILALSHLKPKWFLMENVEGLLTAKNGDYVFEAAKAFIELGYTIRIEKVYAHEYGVPQRRKRVFIIGNSLSLDFEMPEPFAYATGSIFRNGAATLREAIGGLPSPIWEEGGGQCYSSVAATALEEYYRDSCTRVSDHYTAMVNGLQRERIRLLRPGQTMKDLPAQLQHMSFQRRAMRRVMDGTPSEKRGGAPSGLKRLFFDEPCLTVTGAATRELIHPVEDRSLTIRECARVQTFPDAFVFEGTTAQRIQQIGNAIPPMLAEVFGTHLLKYGFEGKNTGEQGRLVGFSLTKADGMSPALGHTRSKLLTFTKTYEQSHLF